ncbi:MAG: rhodanese-like domain-containing protein [Magnetococcus sp. MYC-9]
MTQSACSRPEIQHPPHTLPSAPHSPMHPKLLQLLPDEAFVMLQEGGAVFVDIRSEVEFFFVGNPKGALNIPWQDAPDFELNPNFIKEISHVARKDQTVILICRSGHRSIDAGNALLQVGFQRVYHVLEGFEGDRDENHHRSSVNGWRYRGLPWVQC